MPRFARRQRRGFTLIDVALATVIVTIGTLFIGRYFTTTFDQLNPRGSYGGLRRYLMAEEMLRAEGEGLRMLQKVPATSGFCKLIVEPVNAGFQLNIAEFNMPTSEAKEELHYFDLTMNQNGQAVGTLSLSTLRSLPQGSLDAKIGL